MMLIALQDLECRREETVITGDCVDAGVIAGIEAQTDPILVLSGVTHEADLQHFTSPCMPLNWA